MKRDARGDTEDVETMPEEEEIEKTINPNVETHLSLVEWKES